MSILISDEREVAMFLKEALMSVVRLVVVKELYEVKIREVLLHGGGLK